MAKSRYTLWWHIIEFINATFQFFYSLMQIQHNLIQAYRKKTKSNGMKTKGSCKHKNVECWQYCLKFNIPCLPFLNIHKKTYLCKRGFDHLVVKNFMHNNWEQYSTNAQFTVDFKQHMIKTHHGYTTLL